MVWSSSFRWPLPVWSGGLRLCKLRAALASVRPKNREFEGGASNSRALLRLNTSKAPIRSVMTLDVLPRAAGPTRRPVFSTNPCAGTRAQERVKAVLDEVLADLRAQRDETSGSLDWPGGSRCARRRRNRHLELCCTRRVGGRDFARQATLAQVAQQLVEDAGLLLMPSDQTPAGGPWVEGSGRGRARRASPASRFPPPRAPRPRPRLPAGGSLRPAKCQRSGA